MESLIRRVRMPNYPTQPEPDSLPTDGVLAAGMDAERGARAGGARSVVRSPRRRRNQVCIAIIALGLLNYLAYTVTYAIIGGDAHNGRRETIVGADGAPEVVYKVRGHFIHSVTGREQEVSRAAWIYSYLHSLTVPLTSGALIISMLVLARPHILATMRGSWISGRLFVGAFGTVVVVASLTITVLFAWDFVRELNR